MVLRRQFQYIFSISSQPPMVLCLQLQYISLISYHQPMVLRQTRNVYYTLARNAPVQVYLIRRQIHMQQTRVQQCAFIITSMYHVIMFMEYTRMKNKQHVLYVPLILVMQHMENYTHKRSLCYLKL